MAIGIRVSFEPLRESVFGSITASYTQLGNSLSDNARLITFQNNTNQDVLVSFDGVTDHLKLPSNSFKLFDFTSNKARDDGFFLSVNTQIFIKYVSTLGTSGSFWSEVVFAEGGK